MPGQQPRVGRIITEQPLTSQNFTQDRFRRIEEIDDINRTAHFRRDSLYQRLLLLWCHRLLKKNGQVDIAIRIMGTDGARSEQKRQLEFRQV